MKTGHESRKCCYHTSKSGDTADCQQFIDYHAYSNPSMTTSVQRRCIISRTTLTFFYFILRHFGNIPHTRVPTRGSPQDANAQRSYERAIAVDESLPAPVHFKLGSLLQV